MSVEILRYLTKKEFEEMGYSLNETPAFKDMLGYSFVLGDGVRLARWGKSGFHKEEDFTVVAGRNYRERLKKAIWIVTDELAWKCSTNSKLYKQLEKLGIVRYISPLAKVKHPPEGALEEAVDERNPSNSKVYTKV